MDKIRFSDRTMFRTRWYELVKDKFKEAITEHILSSDESQYFALDVWFSDKKLTENEVELLVECRMKELADLGWECTRSFGGTGLFIHAPGNRPANCWVGEF